MIRRTTLLRTLGPRARFCAGLLLVGLAGCVSAPGSEPGELEPGGAVAVAPEAALVPATAIDVEHYAIELELLPDVRRIQATTSVRLWPLDGPLDALALDLEGLDVWTVTDDQGRRLDYRQADGKLTIELAETLPEDQSIELAIEYGGEPKKGLWFAGDRGAGPTHVFTQGECEDARWWFPCIDTPAERATSEIRVSMPAGWVSTAAGELVERVSADDRTTEHWRMATPHPAYLVTLVAGEFEVVEDDWEGVPLSVLATREWMPYTADAVAETGPILAFLSDLTGLRYPYPKYSQAFVENFPFGGMENISATTLTTRALRDERGLRDDTATGLIAHEAAHQWFGDLLTCRDWSHVWLNEGFATYATLLYHEHSRGVDDFRVRMRETQASYRKGDTGSKRRPIVWDVYSDPMDLFFGGHTYPGGASRLHLLRSVLGDDAFFAGLRTYVAENQNRGVVTDDFKRAMEKSSGRDLAWFFDQWLYGPGFPEFRVSWKWSERKGEVSLRVEQTQAASRNTPRAFRTPVDVEIRDDRGTTLHRLDLSERSQEFRLPSHGRPTWVRFDKYGWIPGKTEAQKQPSEWLAILASDDDVGGRLDAAAALGELAAGERNFDRRQLYVAELQNRLRTDTVPAVRAAAATALARSAGIEERGRLIQAANTDEDAGVRVAALEALATFGAQEELAAVASSAFEAGYSWKTMGAAAGLYVAAVPDDAYAWLTRNLLLDSPRDVLRAELIGHLGRLDEPGVVDQLVGWARDTSADSATRAAAAKALGGQRRGGARVSKELANMLDDEDHSVRRAAVEALAERGDGTSRRALEGYYPESLFPGEKRTIEAALRKGSSIDD